MNPETHISRRSTTRVANLHANKEKMVELVRKKRIVGISCFHEQKINSINNFTSMAKGAGVDNEEECCLMSSIKKQDPLTRDVDLQDKIENKR